MSNSGYRRFRAQSTVTFGLLQVLCVGLEVSQKCCTAEVGRLISEEGKLASGGPWRPTLVPLHQWTSKYALAESGQHGGNRHSRRVASGLRSMAMIQHLG